MCKLNVAHSENKKLLNLEHNNFLQWMEKSKSTVINSISKEKLHVRRED